MISHILGVICGLNPVANTIPQSTYQYPKSLTFADLASVLPAENHLYSNNNISYQNNDPRITGNNSNIPPNLPIISENRNMSLTQALQNFMTNSSKTMVGQDCMILFSNEIIIFPRIKHSKSEDSSYFFYLERRGRTKTFGSAPDCSFETFIWW